MWPQLVCCGFKWTGDGATRGVSVLVMFYNNNNGYSSMSNWVSLVELTGGSANTQPTLIVFSRFWGFLVFKFQLHSVVLMDILVDGRDGFYTILVRRKCTGSWEFLMWKWWL